MTARLTLRDIIPFHHAHMPEVVDLWIESWSKTFPAIDFEARRVWFVDHLVAALDGGSAVRLAFTETGDIAGFVLIDPRTGYLDQIAVGSPWWGKGIAEALLEAARELCPERIELDVNQDNPRAVAFYLRNGFVEIGEGVNPRSGLATLKLEWRSLAQAAG